VETQIGPTLREARIRRKVDLNEIEARTKIRVRYLRALENEEWDLLPGPTYARSFIRTYAGFLGLDGERLADDFRRLQEVHAEPAAREPRALPSRIAGTGGGPRIGAGLVAGLVALALIVILVVLGLTGGSGGGGPSSEAAKQAAKARQQRQQAAAAKRRGVKIRLAATAEVWVCAEAGDGTRVVNGVILQPGAHEGPFRSGKFELAFGNGGIDLNVNGKPFQVKDTPSPVGYEVTPKRVRLLQPGTRPDCT
jgi:Helix-turn-helix domain/RodZ C-terminal domain